MKVIELCKAINRYCQVKITREWREQHYENAVCYEDEYDDKSETAFIGAAENIPIQYAQAKIKRFEGICLKPVERDDGTFLSPHGIEIVIAGKPYV